MAKDTQSYCESCDACNRAKPPAPQPVPMINTPIGRPWEMLGVDILKAPISCQGNSYLLVIQDYFTKWPIAIPLQDKQQLQLSEHLFHLWNTIISTLRSGC